MKKNWMEKIKEAQTQLTCNINGKSYKRIRYGEGAFDCLADKQPCGDCGVTKGQLHVHSCDLEVCPVCSGQFISCGCNCEGDKKK